MKNSTTTLIAILMLFVGAGIGYLLGMENEKESSAQNLPETNEAQQIIEGKGVSLKQFLDKLEEEKADQDNPKLISDFKFNVNTMASILGNHEICKKDYDKFRDDFWGTNPVVESKIDVDGYIITPNLTTCDILDYIEFKPGPLFNLSDTAPACQKTFTVENSCYPFSLFFYMNSLSKKFGMNVYMTKGVKTIDIGGTPTPIRMVMFKMVDPANKFATIYYDIVNDPSRPHVPYGSAFCLP